ncbi:MAG TPA: DNA alkylation repair protein [Candidatus Saccharimonadales bacterium]
MSTAQAAKTALRQAANPEKAVFFPRFFKAGPGEYAEGDQFLGVTVPHVRLVAKRYADLSLTEIELLLTSKWHEERLLALIILVQQTKKANESTRQQIFEFYLAHTAYINNWDLVDTSAGYVVGVWLDGRPEKMSVLKHLAQSESLWERRIAMIATFAYIKQGRADEALIIAEILLYDKHDLIQKAVGWMLREIGKRVDGVLLTEFLDMYAATMPRTSLRYAIEHFTPETRRHYLLLAKQ